MLLIFGKGKQMAKGKKQVPKDESKKAKFKRLVEPRVSKAIKSIALIGNCAGSAYEYTENDVADIMAALQASVEKLQKTFESKGVSTGGFSLGK